MEIKQVNFFSVMVLNPAAAKAFRQQRLEKKCVKPIVKAKKLGMSLKCSTIITFPVGVHTRLHSFKNKIFSLLLRISCAANIKKTISTD
jgi:hypothetical protein